MNNIIKQYFQTTFLIILIRNIQKIIYNYILLGYCGGSIMKTIFGLTCQSCLYPGISAHGTTTLTYLKNLKKSQQASYVINKAKSNISSLETLLKKTAENGIKAFRISDNLIPMADLDLFDIQKQFKEDLAKVGSIANQLNMYLSYHPSQFFLLTSKNPKVIDTSVRNFNNFAKILALMKLKNKPVLLTHVGAIKCYLNYQQACDAFCENFRLMSQQAQEFFAVENDQTSHSIDSCMYIHKKLGIPVVFDHAHYHYKPVSGIDQRQALKLALGTWRDRVPKVHLCSQAPGVKIHNHGDYIDPKDFLTLKSDIQSLGVKEVIMMVEVKKKDEAILKLIEQVKKKGQQISM